LVGLADEVSGAADALAILADRVIAVRVGSALNALVVLADGAVAIGAVVVPVSGRSVVSATVGTFVV